MDLAEATGPQTSRPPTPPRTLSGFDLGVLWGDLSIGLLVMFTGSLLVPALSGPAALAAIGIGGVIGCAALAFVSLAGAREGLPTMTLLRPMLGRRGSFVPTAFNVVQLVGWTAVELWAMGKVANLVSMTLFGLDMYPAWLVVATVLCGGLALAGPRLVVRVWLERFGVWFLVAAALWLTWSFVREGAVADFLSYVPAQPGLPFWAAVDLVIVMPISWLPLAADYSRFAKPGARVGRGVFVGYLAGNSWFYALGAILMGWLSSIDPAVPVAGASVVGMGKVVLVFGGGLAALAVLLVGETDEAFANIYSAAVSARNAVPRVSQRALVVGVTLTGAVIALPMKSLDTFETFLYLLGSVFVPLFAVFFVSYFLRGERAVGAADFRWRAFIPWGVGFVVYHWCAPYAPSGWMSGVQQVMGRWLHLPFPLFGGALGASIPGFVAAFAVALLVLSRPGPSAEVK